MLTKNLVAYADPWSVTSGDTLRVMVSCHAGQRYRAELVRLICGDDRPHGTGFREQPVAAGFAGDYPARDQPLRPGSYAVLPGLPGFDAVSVCVWLYPTTPERDGQVIASRGDLEIRIHGGRLEVARGARAVTSRVPLHRRRWHAVRVSFDGAEGAVTVAVRRLGRGAGERDLSWTADAGTVSAAPVAAGDWLLGARLADGAVRAGLNGRLEAPRIVSGTLDDAGADRLLAERAPVGGGLAGAWDFARGIGGDTLHDVSGHGRHGHTVQTPTRAVAGVAWDGTVQRWQDAPSQYAAVHFHEDDLTDAGWRPDFTWEIPDDLASGVYAVKLTLDDAEGSEDHVPFFVRPAPHHTRAPVAYLVATATYIAYANQRLGFSGGIFGERKVRHANEAYLLEHPDVGLSLYEQHADGSGVHHSSRLRPVLNMKPRNVPWGFTADSNITNWLEGIDQPFDVVTDEDLHREGADLLAPYGVVVTGTHPEYHSTAMLDALERWLGGGGRLMYLGGNGFYWRIAHHPDNPAIIEVRRAEDGTRAWIARPGEYYHAFGGEYGGLWRRLGRPPNRLVGVGFAAQGFDGGTYYRLAPGALDPRVAFALAGVDGSDVVGGHGTQGGGAAGEEIDRFDERLGSPAHAVVIASSENHRPGMLRTKEEFHMTQPPGEDPEVRADMVFFETPAGGAVFSVGSISYAGALAHNGFDNGIARITGNVLRRFLDPEPFEYPG